uniref:Uncharacterized protein n=1 Tax=Phaseolus vulgaris TaxID=3885 RepID=V7C9V0_PHAVU|nr:hypothetical protein PHAVU_003G054800g [Phaseolus vulgaris]ESW25661.1 hypothetical protein PHAVU_003G054800g [Phaseolus vulgaris]
MLLFTSSPLKITFSPTKPFASNALILHHSFPRQLSNSSSLCLRFKHKFTNSFTCSLTHSPIHKYVYPDPIPEFAESNRRSGVRKSLTDVR